MNILKTILGLFLCGTVIVTTEADAQKHNKDFSRDTVKIPEITVTALRYPEKINEVPMAITKLGRLQLQNYIGNGFDDAFSSVPGVLVQTRSGTPDMKLTIRGFGARGAGDRSNSGTSRGVKVFTDGMPETEPDGRTSFDNIDMAFVDNIEIVKSNAASIFGNAAGGVVALSTYPSSNRDFLQLNLLGGAWGMRKVAVSAFDAKKNGGLFAGISMTQFDGYRENSSGEKYTADFVLKSELSPRTRLTTILVGGKNLYHIPGPLTKSEFDADPQKANATYLSRDEHRDNYTLRFGMDLDHQFDPINSVKVTAFANPKFLERSERNTFRNFTRYYIGASGMYKNDYQINNTLRNIAIAGLDESYQDGAILFYKLTSSAGRGDLKETKREGANNFGIFVQDELIINDKISLLLGGRYDDVSYYSDSYYVAGETTLVPYEDKHYEHFTPKGAISYLLTPGTTLYASVGGGIEVPAGNETSPSDEYPNLQINPLLDPIISTTYEIGTKNYFGLEECSFISNMNLDLALFYIDTKNELVPYSSGKFFMSAGKTKRLGAELSWGFDFFRDFHLTSSFTYLKGQYEDYIVDLGLIDSEDAGKFENYKDNDIAGIPDMYYYVALKYAPEQFWGLFAEISFEGVNKYFADDANLFEVPSYNILNLSFGMDKYLKVLPWVGLRAYININNLTDEHYASSAFINPSINGTTGEAYYLEPGLPRNVALGFSIKFY